MPLDRRRRLLDRRSPCLPEVRAISHGCRLRRGQGISRAEPLFGVGALRAAPVKSVVGRRHRAGRVAHGRAAFGSVQAFGTSGVIVLVYSAAQPRVRADAPSAGFVRRYLFSFAVPLVGAPPARRSTPALGGHRRDKNMNAAASCHLHRSGPSEGAARGLFIIAGVLSTAVRRAFSTPVVDHKVIGSGQGRLMALPRLRLRAARCAQLRPGSAGGAVSPHGKSFLWALARVLRGVSRHCRLSCSRAWPNPAFERTRCQRASFSAIVPRLPCRRLARPRRAAQRRRWASGQSS
jgi:hypothetical protein